MSEFGAWLFGLIALVIPGFGEVQTPQYYGYMEANYVYGAPASAGRIASIEVTEGQNVEQGEVLFVLEDERLQAALRASEARVAVAQANWHNLETGSRDEEVAVIRATLTKALSDQELAKITLERTEQLAEQGLVPAAKLDTDRARFASADAQVAQLRAQLEVAELPARDAQLLAAQANLAAARADLDSVKSSLEDTRVVAPVGALVERVYFRAGEVAATGAPVVSLLVPGDMKARFFIPEAKRMSFELGDELTLSCDGCGDGIVVTLTYMSADPQHTPPIIFSREERARLVFMAEAKLNSETRLLPGQPVTLVQVPVGDRQ